MDRKVFLKQIGTSLVISLLMLSTDLVQADTLLIQFVEKNASVTRPDRGTSMTQVENQFGKPIRKYMAIGVPPITRWAYDGITVYFENDRVIHSVVNRK